MRYLFASDLHYGLPQLDWIAEQAPAVDAVVLGGEDLDVAGDVDLDASGPECSTRMIKLRGYGIPDAREVQPLNTALAADADGRAAINISVVAGGD